MQEAEFWSARSREVLIRHVAIVIWEKCLRGAVPPAVQSFTHGILLGQPGVMEHSPTGL